MASGLNDVLPRERACTFGSPASLVGISTPSFESDPDTPTIVMLNSGVIHRVGANRLYVVLARALARAGLPSFRFDLNGIGDSEPRTEAESLEAGIDRDVGEALDLLSTGHESRRFVLLGLCSGAQNALRTGCVDPRVAGLVLIDPVAFRTFRFYVRHYGPRLFRLESWRNAITGRNRTLRKLTERMVKLRERRKQETPDFELSGVVRGPTKRETTDRFNALLARGGRLLLIHTGGLDTQFNYRGQFKDGFPEIYSDSGTTFEYLPNADHTFSTEKQRAALLGLVCDWLKQRDWSL